MNTGLPPVTSEETPAAALGRQEFPQKAGDQTCNVPQDEGFYRCITENAPFAGGAATQRAPEQPLVQAREPRKGQHEDVVLC